MIRCKSTPLTGYQERIFLETDLRLQIGLRFQISSRFQTGLDLDSDSEIFQNFKKNF